MKITKILYITIQDGRQDLVENILDVLFLRKHLLLFLVFILASFLVLLLALQLNRWIPNLI